MRSAFFTLSLLVFAISNAQQTDFNFVNFSSNDGLSSNMVNAICKDKFGYMWFGTEDGLNKFDGANFKIYKHKPNDSTSIGGHIITALCEDKDGNLWVGTNKSLSFYDPKKDGFVNYAVVKNGPVRALCVDHLGSIWIGSYSGLYRFDPNIKAVKQYNESFLQPGQLHSNVVVSIFEDSKRRLWIGTTAGLHLYVRETDSFICYEHSDADANSIADNAIRTIAEDINGDIWLGTNSGVSKMLPGNKGFANYKAVSDDNTTLSSNRVYVIARDHSGKLWAGTEGGLNLLDVSTAKAVRLLNNPRNKYSFKGKSIRSILVDKNGIIWFGTTNSGVNKFDQNLAFFNLRQSNPLDPFGLNSSVVMSFVESPSGDIYIGTDGGGLNLFHRKTGRFDRVRLALGNEKEPLSILSLEKVNNELWIGTYQQGLFILNMLTGAVRHYAGGEGPKHIAGQDVFAIKTDTRGLVWIGTNGEGVSIYNPQSGTFRHLNKSRTVPGEKLPLNGFIRTIEEDAFGNIWIGSHGSGIAVYNSKANSFQLLNQANSNLATENILNIYKDSRDNMWVGTSGGGLNAYDKKTGKFITFSETDGLSNAVVYKILDDSNTLWLSTNAGLSSFDLKKKKFKNYSFQNGLQRGSFNLSSGMKTSTGELFFGGVDGFNFFDPQTLYSNKNIPALVFTDLKVSNQSVSPGENAVIKEHISIAKEIRLDFKQNFSIDFAALNFTSPQDNRYYYKLQGFDKDWNSIGNAHTAVYTNLDPGQYTFYVKAKSDDGLWATPEKTIKIFVKPPFWKTTYAYVAYVLFVCLMVALMRYRGIRKLKNKFAIEQEKIQAKQMLEQQRREAEQQHEFDILKIKFLTNLSHEFRTPISLIVGPVEKLLQTEPSEEKQQQLNLVQRNARRLLNLVNQLLDFRKMEEKELKLSLAEGDIISFIKDVADSFKDFSEYKHINFTIQTSLENYYTSFDKDKIERILFNLLSNAFKFTAAEGSISLQVETSNDSQLQITLSDTGVGMTKKEKEKIFERFYQGNIKTSVLNQGTGIGLSITNEFVKMHGGNIRVESEPGKGSRFIIQLPLQQIEKKLLEQSPIEVDTLLEKSSDQNVEVFYADKPTILIVEDHDDFRGYLKETLSAFYKIVEASNGQEGWQKTLATHPSIIVSDVSMPVMDGITLSKKLKSDKRTSHIPVILLTALTGNTNQMTGLQTGASDYLTKPFHFEILHLKIKNLLELNLTLKQAYTKQFKVNQEEVVVESVDEKLFSQIVKYIEVKIDSPDLSVDDLSKHVFMSRGSLYNKIVSMTGETPVEFIRSIRLNKAVALIENSDMKIGEIGYAVGFATPNYFARAFKAKYNTSPSEYLQLKRKIDKNFPVGKKAPKQD